MNTDQQPTYAQTATAQPKRKGGKKKWIIGGVATFLLIGAIGAANEGDMTEQPQAATTTSAAPAPVETTMPAPAAEAGAGDPQLPAEPTPTATPTKPAEDIPDQGEEALASAQNYIDMMGMSKKGLTRQLTSEVADAYPQAAAKYAAEHVDVDWNAEALEAAQNYQQTMPMSKTALKRQLTSSVADGFTEAQAEYAVSHL